MSAPFCQLQKQKDVRVTSYCVQFLVQETFNRHDFWRYWQQWEWKVHYNEEHKSDHDFESLIILSVIKIPDMNLALLVYVYGQPCNLEF